MIGAKSRDTFTLRETYIFNFHIACCHNDNILCFHFNTIFFSVLNVTLMLTSAALNYRRGQNKFNILCRKENSIRISKIYLKKWLQILLISIDCVQYGKRRNSFITNTIRGHYWNACSYFFIKSRIKKSFRHCLLVTALSPKMYNQTSSNLTKVFI